jgi:hypothetical protein
LHLYIWSYDHPQLGREWGLYGILWYIVPFQCLASILTTPIKGARVYFFNDLNNHTSLTLIGIMLGDITVYQVKVSPFTMT